MIPVVGEWVALLLANEAKVGTTLAVALSNLTN